MSEKSPKKRKVPKQFGRGRNLMGKSYPQDEKAPINKPLKEENKQAFYEREKDLFEPADTQSHPKLTPADLVSLETSLRCGFSIREAVFRLNEVRVRRGYDEITPETVYSYQKKFPERFGQLKLWSQESLDRVEKNLMSLAEGVIVWEEKAVVVSDGMDCGSHIEVKVLEKKIAPNLNAAQFILKNMRPDRWKDDQRMILEGLNNLSDEELLAKAKEAIENMTKANKNTKPEK